MQELKFVRTEDGSLVVTDDVGEFYKVLVDDAVVSGIRVLARGDHKSKVSPREIQGLIRAGKTASEVVAITGADPADVERFELPVLDERNFILEKALRVDVVTNLSETHPATTTFGEAMASRFENLGSQNVAWSSWKDEQEGWIIAAQFSSHGVDHRPLWFFDHRKQSLMPKNEEAKTLSKQGDVGDRLIPKLRAVENNSDDARFDSGAFHPEPTERFEADTEVVTPVEVDAQNAHPTSYAAFREPEDNQTQIEERTITREPEPVDFGQTADLLEALRRRRGERDSQPQPTISVPEVPSVPNAQETSALDREAHAEPDDAHQDQKTGAKRGRPGMPSWDDILFGTRSEEDPF